MSGPGSKSMSVQPGRAWSDGRDVGEVERRLPADGIDPRLQLLARELVSLKPLPRLPESLERSLALVAEPGAAELLGGAEEHLHGGTYRGEADEHESCDLELCRGRDGDPRAVAEAPEDHRRVSASPEDVERMAEVVELHVELHATARDVPTVVAQHRDPGAGNSAARCSKCGWARPVGGGVEGHEHRSDLAIGDAERGREAGARARDHELLVHAAE
jgi:hypothetical protein